MFISGGEKTWGGALFAPDKECGWEVRDIEGTGHHHYVRRSSSLVKSKVDCDLKMVGAFMKADWEGF